MGMKRGISLYKKNCLGVTVFEPPERHICGLEENIKTDHKKLGESRCEPIRIGINGDSCEHITEPSRSTRRWGISGVPERFLILFFYILDREAIGTAATHGLLCQPRVIVKMIVEKHMECRLAGETEVLGEKTSPAPLLSITKSHMTRPGFEPGPPRWEAGD
jgi:hypothetical protein